VRWDGRLRRDSIELCYDEMTGGDAGLLRLLELVRDHGLAFVRGAPTELDVVERVAGLIGYIPETNYGRIFDYYADPTPSTPANAADFLAPHTDEAYRHRPPQIALFHAIRQSVDGGGASLFVDGFAAAERLRTEDPEAFAFLARVPLSYRRIQPGTPPGAGSPPAGLLPPKHTGADMRSRGRAIALDGDGQICGIRFADINLSPPDLPEELIAIYYRSVSAFARIVRDPALRLVAPLAGGDMAFFDNERVLHGRTAFDAARGGRHIRSAYVDRESFHSCLRLLGHRLGRADADLVLPGGFGP
jgi:gamma-butyrobetaine dioxygenase